MEMHEIRYFLAASETLNFHRAADLCHVTQPALTRAIQKLEAELGAALFHRERNKVQLTDFGRLMRPHLAEVLDDTRLARQAARSFLKLDAAPLALGVMCTIGPLRFVGLLNAFRARHAGVEMRVVEGVPAQLSAMLLDGALDVALMAQPAGFDARFAVEPLYSERFGLAFPTGHRFEKRNSLRVDDAAEDPYLERINCEYGDHIDAVCGARGIVISSAYRSEREDWIMTMVAAGMGICFAPEFSALVPGVCFRPVEDPEIVRQVALVSVAGRTLSPASARFAAAVRAHDWGPRTGS